VKTQPISRRALAASLALAPVAGLPAIASSRERDPIITACAELQKLRRAEKLAGDKLGADLELYESLLPEQTHISITGGPDYYTLEEFDGSYYAEVLHKADWLRKKREELVEIDAAGKSAERRSGFREAEEAWGAAFDRVRDLEDKILVMVPSSPAGAAALLRLSRVVIEDDRCDAFELALAAIDR